MVERVGDDGVIRAEERLEQSAVGIKAGGKKDGIVHAEKAGEGAFKFAVQIGCAADEAHGGHAVAVLLHGLVGSGNECGVIGEAEVVVGAEVEHWPALGGDMGRLGRADRALAFVKAVCLDLCKCGFDIGEKGGHGALP